MRWRTTRMLVVLLLAACTTNPSVGTGPSSPPTPAPTPVPAATASPTAEPIETPPPTAEPAETASPSVAPSEPLPEPTLPPGPPAAVMETPRGPVTGDPGSFTWSAGGTGFGSQAPWLPGEDAGGFPAGARVSIRFEPALRVGDWSIVAAPAGDQGETATLLADGSGAPVEAPLPLAAGVWEVQLRVILGSARHERGTGDALYFWRVTVAA